MRAKSQYQFFSTTRAALNAMYQAISEAKESIYWEVFIFEFDGIGRKFVKKLLEKAAVGVEIKLILDGWGSWSFTDTAVDKMRAVGIEVLYFNPLRLSLFWRGIRKILERTHRKLLIVDRRRGFIGGVNVENESIPWFDLQVRVEGPIVRQLLRSFSRAYLAGGGTLDKIRHIFYLPVSEERYWRVLWHKPQGNFSIIHRSYLRAIARAKKSLTLVSPYFFPDREFLKALREARQRGVDVHLILPYKTNHPVLTYAMRAYWQLLDNFGLKLHLVKKMIHAKAMMVDDKWAMVGSSNMDPQTFYRSHEANLIFTRREMIDDLKRIFRAWKKAAFRFRRQRWEGRPWWKRAYEWFWGLFRPIL